VGSSGSEGRVLEAARLAQAEALGRYVTLDNRLNGTAIVSKTQRVVMNDDHGDDEDVDDQTNGAVVWGARATFSWLPKSVQKKLSSYTTAQHASQYHRK
jgi:hypothetical protein